MPCPRCGSPAPHLDRIQPLGIRMERVYSNDPRPLLIGNVPAGIPWNCRCGAPRSIDWNEATEELRRKAIDQHVLGLMMGGWI